MFLERSIVSLEMKKSFKLYTFIYTQTCTLQFFRYIVNSVIPYDFSRHLFHYFTSPFPCFVFISLLPNQSSLFSPFTPSDHPYPAIPFSISPPPLTPTIIPYNYFNVCFMALQDYRFRQKYNNIIIAYHIIVLFKLYFVRAIWVIKMKLTLSVFDLPNKDLKFHHVSLKTSKI